MINYKSGNIFSEPVEAIVNTVNCVGIMGRGVALQFKKNYPQNFKAYKVACDNKEVEPGKMFVYQINALFDPKYIINFPTKRHWRSKSKIEDIRAGLLALAEEIQTRQINSIAIPPLGCGLGGLDWKEVRYEMEKALKDLDNVNIIIFEPSTSGKASFSKEVPKMTPGRAALIGLMYAYLGGLMDPFVTLLEIHKLMYFMQEAGQPLKLEFNKASYGPYAENLRHVLNLIEGHFITGYEDGGDDPFKEIGLVPGAVKEAMAYLETQKETIAKFKQVEALVEGFETSFGLELLATVHWVVTKEKAENLESATKLVYAWADRKKCFTERHIRIAYETLQEQEWFVNSA